jgi:hypothetical protein
MFPYCFTKEISANTDIESNFIKVVQDTLVSFYLTMLGKFF